MVKIIQSTQTVFLLIQKDAEVNSRMFYIFQSLDECLESIVRLHEEQLRASRSGALRYDITELFVYLEAFTELFILLYNQRRQAYVPRDRQWIKHAVYNWLSAQVTAC